MTDIPHDDIIERATLGALLLQPHRVVEIADLSPLVFWGERNRVVYIGMADCLRRHKKLDPVLLLSTLKETGRDEAAGGGAYIGQLLDSGARGANLDAYSERLRDLELRRAAIQGANEVATLAAQDGVDAAIAALKHYAATIQRRAVWEPMAVDMSRLLEDEVPPIPWLVDGWLGQGDLATLAGEWATGKSIVAMDLAISVAAGLSWMGRIPVVTPGPVLYLDEENNPHNAHRRLARMVRGRDIDPVLARELPIRYLSRNRIHLEDRRSKDMVRREIDRSKAKLVVLDSLIRFHRRNENKSDEMAAFYADAVAPLIAEFGVAILTLDHMRKPGENDKGADTAHRLRGSGDKAGVVDDLWTLEGDRDESTRILSCRKNRWEDTLPPPIQTTWKSSEDEAAAWIVATDATMKAEAVIVGLVAGAETQGVRASALFDAASQKGVARSTTIRTLKRLVKEGSVHRRTEGKNGTRYWSDKFALTTNA